jgi:phage-related protein
LSTGQTEGPKPLFWIGSSRSKHLDAKVLKGFGGAGVLEVVSDHDGQTFRTVYTVRFAGAVYVLHAFQKKSKKGIKTPQSELEIVRKRLKEAEEDYATRRAEEDRRGRPGQHGAE